MLAPPANRVVQACHCIQVDCYAAKVAILQQAATLRQALQRQIAAAWVEANREVSTRSGSALLTLACWS